VIELISEKLTGLVWANTDIVALRDNSDAL
jgi:hypothetical protein